MNKKEAIIKKIQTIVELHGELAKAIYAQDIGKVIVLSAKVESAKLEYKLICSQPEQGKNKFESGGIVINGNSQGDIIKLNTSINNKLNKKQQYILKKFMINLQ